MAADDTRSTQSSEPKTAVRGMRTPPTFSPPSGSIAARLAAVSYHPQLGSAAAWDAAQWNLTSIRSTVNALYARHAATDDPAAKATLNSEIIAAEERQDAAYSAAFEMPSPHMAALLWKMQEVLEIEPDGFTASYSAAGIKPVMDDAARFASAERSPTRLHSEWATARATYVVAREGEEAAGAANDVASEERWTKRRYAAEDALMAIPSPDASAFAFKFMVAKGGGRETDCWDAMLEQEALLFAQVEG